MTANVPSDYICVADVYKLNSKPYKAARSWLYRNAKIPAIRRGNRTYWHKTEFDDFVAQYNPNFWQELFTKVFSESRTQREALDLLGNEGVFPDEGTFNSSVRGWYQRGLLRKEQRGNAVLWKLR